MAKKYIPVTDIGAVIPATTHATNHQNGGIDEISVAGLSGVLADAQTPAAHAHAATDITSATMVTARLGSGTANDSTFLRGDSTWAAPTAAAADPSFAPGDFTVETGKFRCHVKRLILTSTERATLQGTATLRIS